MSDGDYFYLVEGDEEALVIDSGYGCGNVREYCQSLTEKPVRYIANTHDHFDHTANNVYFDCAFMAAESVPLATRPFPSFAGIDFPRDYKIEVIDEGYVFHLGNRDLEVLKCRITLWAAFCFWTGRNVCCLRATSWECRWESR